MSKKKTIEKNITDTEMDEKNVLLEKEIESNTFVSSVLDLHKIPTLNRLTKYERARILGTRATQIQNGMSPVFLKDGKIVGIPDEFKDVVKNSIDLAKLELQLKSTPLIIKRVLPSGRIIEKTVQELE